MTIVLMKKLSLFGDYLNSFIRKNVVCQEENFKTTQVRFAEGDNTAQYWPNLGSQESAIVIGPVSMFASVKCWADVGSLF